MALASAVRNEDSRYELGSHHACASQFFFNHNFEFRNVVRIKPVISIHSAIFLMGKECATSYFWHVLS